MAIGWHAYIIVPTFSPPNLASVNYFQCVRNLRYFTRKTLLIHTALRIYQSKLAQDYELKARLGGETSVTQSCLSCWNLSTGKILNN